MTKIDQLCSISKIEVIQNPVGLKYYQTKLDKNLYMQIKKEEQDYHTNLT